MNEDLNTGSTLSATLLIAGTCIGAGMLALPVTTGIAGFVPAISISIVCWLFMLATGLLFLEATLWMDEGSNLLSMAGRFLGQWGRWIGGGSFVFLYYCLMIAYIAGGSPLLGDLIEKVTGYTPSHGESLILFTGIIALVVYAGVSVTDHINWLLMCALGISYVAMIAIGSMEIHLDYLYERRWNLALMATPTLFGAYGYHNVIPTLTFYLRKNAQKMRLAIILGSTIPFLFYSLWQLIIMGHLPIEALERTAEEGIQISQALRAAIANPWITSCVFFFSFFAVVTSMLGVALSMVDFLGDGFHIQRRTGFIRFLFTLLVFIPPALFASYRPGVFYQALGIAGGFGEAFLNGAIPILMVWVGRYHMGLKSAVALPGGRWTLALLMTFTLVVVGVEVWELFF